MVFLLFMILLLSFLFVFFVVYLLLHHCSLVVSSAFIWFHFFLFLSVFLGCPFMIISPFCSNHQSGESFLMSFFSLPFCLHAPLHRWKWWCLTHLLCCLFLWSLIFISIISYNCYPPRCLTQTQTLLRPKLFFDIRESHMMHVGFTQTGWLWSHRVQTFISDTETSRLHIQTITCSVLF